MQGIMDNKKKPTVHCSMHHCVQSPYENIPHEKKNILSLGAVPVNHISKQFCAVGYYIDF